MKKIFLKKKNPQKFTVSLAVRVSSVILGCRAIDSSDFSCVLAAIRGLRGCGARHQLPKMSRSRCGGAPLRRSVGPNGIANANF